MWFIRAPNSSPSFPSLSYSYDAKITYYYCFIYVSVPFHLCIQNCFLNCNYFSLPFPPWLDTTVVVNTLRSHFSSFLLLLVFSFLFLCVFSFQPDVVVFLPYLIQMSLNNVNTNNSARYYTRQNVHLTFSPLFSRYVNYSSRPL